MYIVPLKRVCQSTTLGISSFDFRILLMKGRDNINETGTIRDHINEIGQAAPLADFGILDKANNNFDLLIHESLLILRGRPRLHQQNSSIPLYLF